MNTHFEDIFLLSLLQKYIDNRCSEDELRTLLQWLRSEAPKEEFHSFSDSLWDQMENRIVYPDDKRRSEMNQEVTILLNKIRNQNGEQKSQTYPGRVWLQRMVAIFVLLIGLSIGYYITRDNKPSRVTFTEITASKGETNEYIFDDGSKVVLNSGSILRIPSDYNNTGRSVEIEGEGFFDITPDPAKPFIIRSGDKQVKVLGTSFNVKSYEEDDYFEVTVTTGKVLVDIEDMDIRLRVTPMEHLSINKHTGSLSKLTLDENYYTKWMDGFLYFNREPIQEVIKTINRKYDRTVILDCPDCEHIISGTHDNKSIEAVIDAICFTTRLKYRTDGNTIILYK